MAVISKHQVFVTGATGYMGRALIPSLLQRGHSVAGLARSGSEHRLPPGCIPIIAHPLEAASYAGQVPPADTFAHLVGVPHPSPTKEAQFRAIDLPALQASLEAAKAAGVRHFVFVSVAHPAPLMNAFIAVRVECEALIRASGIPATILRPWYVLGPGHRWPYLLIPLYAVLRRLKRTREIAFRLGLVSLAQMIAAMVAAVEHPPDTFRVVEVPSIRSAEISARETLTFQP